MHLLAGIAEFAAANKPVQIPEAPSFGKEVLSNIEGFGKGGFVVADAFLG